jgi:dienelactone hydrolase
MKITMHQVRTGFLTACSAMTMVLSAVIVSFTPDQSSASYRIPSNVVMYPSLPLAVGKEVFQRVIANDTEWAYLIYLPPTYDSTSSKVWPIFYYMQPGGVYYDGWSGQNTSGLFDSARAGLNGGPAYYLNNAPSKFPSISTRFIVVTPFVSNNNSSGGRLMGLFKYLKNRLKVDTTCTSMMGLCIGGQVSYNFAAAYPKFLSSLVTMSTNGSGSPCNLALACNLKNVPYRVYGDQRDPYVPTAATQALYDAVHNCGSTKATLTWTNVGMHEIWGYAGLDTAKEVYDWMLANAGSTTPVAPKASDKQNAGVSMDGWSGLADIDLVGLNGQILSQYRGDPASMNRMVPGINRGVAVMRIHHGSQSVQRVIVSKP